MPLFLIDPPMWFYYILGLVAFGGFFVFYKNQTKKSLVTFIIAALPLLALLIVDFTEESPREQVVRKIKAIALATRERRIDEGFAHVSGSIQYHGYDKAGLNSRAKGAYTGAMNGFEWQGASAWDFTREEFQQVNDATATQGFLVKLHVGLTLYCKATFKKDKDGQYRVTGFAFYDPMKRDNDGEIILPGL